MNIGPILSMTENHRTGLLWALMRNGRWIVDGLMRAGFDGAWLNGHGRQSLEQPLDQPPASMPTP